MPIGHIVMVVIEKNGGQEFMFPAAGILGFGGAILIWIGSQDRSEHTATWLGFLEGSYSGLDGLSFLSFSLRNILVYHI